VSPSPNYQHEGKDSKGLCEVMRFRWGHRMEAVWWDSVPLDDEEEMPWSFLSPFLKCVYTNDFS
jgi:hypothetical protein